jgi:hypothetical protein
MGKKGRGAAARNQNKGKQAKSLTNQVQPCKKAPATLNVYVRDRKDASPVAGVKITVDGKPDQLTPKSGQLTYNLSAGDYTITATVPKSLDKYMLVQPEKASRNVTLPPGSTENVTFFVREYATLEVRVYYLDKGSKVYIDQIPILTKSPTQTLQQTTDTPMANGLASGSPVTRWDDIAFATYKISTTLSGELDERYQDPANVVEKTLDAGSREKAELEVLPRNLKLVKVDDHFAPSHESCDITYNILRLKDRDVTLSIYGYGDVLLYQRLLTDGEKDDGDGKVIQWDGTRNQDPKKDQYTTPIDGPLTVKLECGTVWKGQLPFKILYHSIELGWGVHTPDGNQPPPAERVKYMQYRLNVLGYDGGPVNGVLGTVTTNALKRFQRANYQVGTTNLLNARGFADDPTRAALQGAPVDRSGTRWETGKNPLTQDAKLYIEDNFFADRGGDCVTLAVPPPEFSSGDRQTYVEPFIERPYIPLEVKVKLLTKGDSGVDAPQAIGEVPIGWEMDDARPEDSASTTVTINIPPPVKIRTQAVLPDDVVGSAVQQIIQARFGTHPYTWSVTAGVLPKGLNLDTGSGLLSGTLSEEAVNKFTVTATDAAGKTDAREFTLKVTKFAIVTDSMPAGLPGKAYNLTLKGAGGKGALKNWKVTPDLPARLSLDPKTGVISGKPAAAAPLQDYTFEVSDRTGTKATKVLSFEVKTSQITTAALPDGTPGKDYTQTLAATGSPPFSNWRIVSGDLPAGLAFDATGAFSGKPLGAVEASLVFECTDSGGATIQKELDLNIKFPLKVTTAELPHGAKGTDYAANLAGEGGTPTYTFAVKVGNLPKGLQLSPGGAISGKPKGSGSSKVAFEISDSSGGAAVSKVFQLTIAESLAIATATSLGDTMINTAFSTALATAGGTAPFIWSLPGNPPGWAVDAAGNLSSTPDKKGTVSIAVKVVDSTSKEATKTFTVNVVERQMAPPPSPEGAPGAAYPERILAPTGGTVPYSNYHVDSGALPPGISIDPLTGKINGTPTAYGTFKAKVETTDASTPPIDSGTNLSARNYVLRALQIGATPNITAAPRIDKNGDNILTMFGGFRDEDPAANIKNWFPDDADSKLAPYTVSDYAKETRDGKEYHCALTKCWDHKTDFRARCGRAGVYFRHSKIAGDDAKIRAALTFHNLPNKDELDKLHAPRKDHLFKETGRWQVWRRMRVSAYYQQRAPTRVPADPDWGWAAARWKEAFLEVENNGSPLATPNYPGLINSPKYQAAITGMPAGYVPNYSVTGAPITAGELTYRAGGVWGDVDIDENNVARQLPNNFKNRVLPLVTTWDEHPINAILKEIHAEVRKTSPEGLIVYDFSLYHQALRMYDVDRVARRWVYQDDWNPYTAGYVRLDGAVTMDVNNPYDVSCYTTHEAGHGRFLQHHITSGGSADASDFPDHHDAEQVRCIMSYTIDRDTPDMWRYSFCGKCLLKLRGVDISGLPNRYTHT